MRGRSRIRILVVTALGALAIAAGAYAGALDTAYGTATKTPPAIDCNNTTFVGRLVMQQKGKKVTLWACTSLGTWVKV